MRIRRHKQMSNIFKDQTPKEVDEPKVPTNDEGTEVIEPETIPPKAPEGDNPPAPNPPIDYEKKFKESSREVQRLLGVEEENAAIKQAILEKDKPSDWEFMSDEQKESFRKEKEKELRIITLEAKEKWRLDYASIPQDLKEKIEKKGKDNFKTFCCSPENVGQKSIENLAKAYTFDVVTAPTDPKPKPKGLESAGGSNLPKAPVRKEGEMTASEANQLRYADPKRYNELIIKGKMKIID